MKSNFLRSVAALLAGLTLAAGAQALSITPRQSSVVVAPGASATVEFDIDFGADPQAFMALAIDLDFLPLELSSDANAVTLSFAGAEPQFALGEFFRHNHDGGSSISWIIGAGGGGVPTVKGTAVLSVPLTNFAIASVVPLTAHLLLFAPDDSQFYAAATTDVMTTAVPEPQAWLLALAGGCFLVVLRRRAS